MSTGRPLDGPKRRCPLSLQPCQRERAEPTADNRFALNFLIFGNEIFLFQRINLTLRSTALRSALLPPLAATAKSQTIRNPELSTKPPTFYRAEETLTVVQKRQSLIQGLSKAVEPTCSLQMPICWPRSGVLVSFQKETRATTDGFFLLPKAARHAAFSMHQVSLVWSYVFTSLRFPN